MSVKVEVIEGGVPHNNILAAGLVSTLVCLYLTYLNVLTGTQLFSFFGGLAVVAALVWGSHTIKVLCSYGIGTGVPSAGMIAFGSGVIAMLLATKFGVMAPIVAAILAAVIGFILGYVSNNILNMKIPAMVQALTEMAVVGALSLMGFASMITGGIAERHPRLRVAFSHGGGCGCKIAPAILSRVVGTPDPDMALSQVDRFLTAVGGRTMVYALLSENRNVIDSRFRFRDGLETFRFVRRPSADARRRNSTLGLLGLSDGFVGHTFLPSSTALLRLSRYGERVPRGERRTRNFQCWQRKRY